jgi:hypothetical protein
MPAKLAPPSVVRTIAPQVPELVRHRAVPSIHHSWRLTAVNDLGWKSAGMTPPPGPGMVVVVELVGAEVEVVELVGVLLHAAAVRVRTARAVPITERVRGRRLVALRITL